MPEKRRTKYDIYADLIDVIVKKGTCSLTLLSYGVNLPVDRAKKTLQLLVSHGFVKEVSIDQSRKYRVTRRGLEFLETYRKLNKFFAGLEQPVSLPASVSAPSNRLPSGSQELDDLLLGGLPQNYSIVLTSPSCNERQLLIDGFLQAGLKSGNVAVDISTEVRSNTRRLAMEYNDDFHIFLCNPQADNMIEDLPNVSKLRDVGNLNDLNIVLASTFRRMEQRIDEPKRMCVEIVSDVLLYHHAVHTRRWLIGLTTDLKARGFTVLGVMNPFMHTNEEVQAILDLFEGEIDIYEKETEGGFAKYLKVRKMYDQDYLEHGVPMGRKTANSSLVD